MLFFNPGSVRVPEEPDPPPAPQIPVSLRATSVPGRWDACVWRGGWCSAALARSPFLYLKTPWAASCLAAGIAASHVVKRIMRLHLFRKWIWSSAARLCRVNVHQLNSWHPLRPLTPPRLWLHGEKARTRPGRGSDFAWERSGIPEQAGHAGFSGVFQRPCFLWKGTFFWLFPNDLGSLGVFKCDL